MGETLYNPIFCTFVMKVFTNLKKYPMLKQLLSTAIFVMALSVFVNAQCTPGPYFFPGIYPDTVTNLPPATEGTYYNTTVTIVVPTDTTISGFNATIDSLGVTSITGLPASLSYAPNDPYWPGGTSGCVAISGTPTHAEAITQGGIYPIIVNSYGYGKYLGFPISSALPPYTGFKIKIDSISGVAELISDKFIVGQNSPNPFSNYTTIEFSSPSVAKYELSVCNLIGEVVYKRSINAAAGKNKIEFSGYKLSSGIYLYKLSNDANTITKRMIIEKN